MGKERFDLIYVDLNGIPTIQLFQACVSKTLLLVFDFGAHFKKWIMFLQYFMGTEHVLLFFLLKFFHIFNLLEVRYKSLFSRIPLFS